jgi:hypothetical protein
MASVDLSARDGAVVARESELARYAGGGAGDWASRLYRGDMILAGSCA